VFISSTFSDLSEERKAAIEAIFDRGHIPIALERFSPADESDLQVIQNAMANSQIYILILGHRYGDIVPGGNVSFTELEYDLAQERGLFALVFIMDEVLATEKRRKLDPNIIRDAQELSNLDRFTRFRKKVSTHFRKY